MNIDQANIFEYTLPTYKINKPVRLIELFAGIGSQAKALERLGIDFETYKVFEIDKYAIASYNAIHNSNFETQDITKIHANDLEIVNTKDYIYVMTYSFPCQDLSLAGKRKGMNKGENTRSGLLWEVERILDECVELPQVLLMENVPQVIGKKNIDNFNLWRKKLESLGYSNYVELLNAKNYGIPQNRERCFMVSILGNYYYQFPLKQELKLKLKDLLEDEVDEKYYISPRQMEGMLNTNFHQYSLEHSFEKNLKQKLEEKLLQEKLVEEGDIIRHSYSTNRIENYEERGKQIKKNLSPTLDTRCDCLGVVVKDKLEIKEATKKGYAEATGGDGVYINRPHQKRGVVQKDMIQTIKTNCNDIGVVVNAKDK